MINTFTIFTNNIHIFIIDYNSVFKYLINTCFKHIKISSKKIYINQDTNLYISNLPSLKGTIIYNIIINIDTSFFIIMSCIT